MTQTTLILCHLIVMANGSSVYDQKFHRGVNIIRGENGSGKSTIADFIFYVLGGEFVEWKDKASLCDEVRAEIYTQSGPITLRRLIADRQEPISVFFGPMKDAFGNPFEAWKRYPIRRQSDKSLGFSQVIFRACGIPEAPIGEGGNVTAHQVLRLLYSDQRTPAPRLFRFERFDTRDIRKAVGDLLLGANTYELYNAQIELRGANKILVERKQALILLLGAIPKEFVSMTNNELAKQIAILEKESETLIIKMQSPDDDEPGDANKAFDQNRDAALKRIRLTRAKLRQVEEVQEKLEIEIADLGIFVDYLEETMAKANAADCLGNALGNIDFAYCPACLAPVDEAVDSTHCVLCAKPVDPERESARYLEIKLDISLQLRESHQLLDAKTNDLHQSKQEVRRIRKDLRRQSTEFQSTFELVASPREAKLALINNRIGQIEQQISYLGTIRELAERVTKLAKERDDAQSEVDRLNTHIKHLERATSSRVHNALSLVESTARTLLKQDLKRQEEFAHPDSVSIDFGDDAVLVDGKMNFAESSNVILKNTVLLALLGAAAKDEKFYHPRFLLMDNVEDKGMEQVRSYNFQKIIVDLSNKISAPHQIIFTTSMLNPELDLDRLTIGPHYNEENRTLDF